MDRSMQYQNLHSGKRDVIDVRKQAWPWPEIKLKSHEKEKKKN